MTYTPGDTHREIFRSAYTLAPAVAANSYVFYQAAGAVVLNAAGSVFGAFYFDPTDLRASHVKVVAHVITSAVAPGASWEVKLCPVATWGGVSNERARVATVGTAVSSVTFTTPGANTRTRLADEDFAPAAGWYVMVLVQTGTVAANSYVDVQASLLVRCV